MSASAPILDPAARRRIEATLHALESDRGANWPLLAGLLASLLFHGALMAPQVRDFFAQFHAHDGIDRTRAATFSVEKEMEKRPPPTPEQQQEEEEEMLKLGIEDGTTQSTMTWIGYNEYQEHIAKLSTVDQAAFRDTDQGGQPMPAARPSTPTTPQVPNPELAAPPSPDVNPNPSGPAMPAVAAPAQPATPPMPPAQPAAPPSPQTPPTPTQPAAPPPPPPPSPADTRPSDPTEPKPVAVPPETAATLPTKPSKDAVPIPSADENRVAPQIQPVEKAGSAKEFKDAPLPPTADKPLDVPPAPPQPKPDDSKPQDRKPDETKPDDRMQEPAKPDEPKQPLEQSQQQPAPQQPPQPQQPQQPAQPASAPPTQAAPGPSQPSTSPTTGPSPDPSARPGAKPGPKADGDLSEQESDATSVTAAPTKDWKSGKPLAAKGIKVNTRRPFFDELTTISTAPANPLALIEFNKAGKAVSATLLEGSGFDSVDQPILDSLYGWTVDVAKSPQLQKLKPGQTLKFKIRLLLK